jgi:hypothetical protein
MQSASALAFLRALYGGNAPGFLVLWTRQDKRTYWVPATRPDYAAQLVPLLAESKDVYFGVGLQREALDVYHRGTAESIIALPGFWGDFDVQGQAHKTSTLPPTKGAARALVAEFPLLPTLVVDSGFGLQV